MWLLECDGDALNGLRIWLKPNTRSVLGRTRPKPNAKPAQAQGGPAERAQSEGGPAEGARADRDRTEGVEAEGSKAEGGQAEGGPDDDGKGKADENSLRFNEVKDASISRVHLTIIVDAVHDGDSSKLHARPVLHLTDSSKKGSTVNDVPIRNSSKSFKECNEVVFYMGRYESAFRIKWHPVVLSMSLSTREKKDRNFLVPFRNSVEGFGVKIITAYHPETSYAVATKRNTALGLQALVNGKSIVMKSYFDAIAKAATAPEGELSPLERDFDTYWPDAAEFLPPAGNEPSDRPPESYAPVAERKTLFDGWIFVFFEEIQYDVLLGPITDAHGKLERFKLEPHRTTAEDVVEFVRKRSQGSSVALVRSLGKKDMQWEADLAAAIERLLGYKMLEQNAFLDVILSCDTSSLCRPLDDDVSPSATATQISHSITQAQGNAGDVPRESAPVEEPPSSPPQAETAAPRPRPRMRRTYIDPFSIDDDEALPPPALPASTRVSTRAQTVVQVTDTQDRQSRYETAPASMDEEMDYVPSSIPETVPLEDRGSSPRAERGNKRPAPAAPVEDADQDIDVMDMLPGARYVKRRKIAEEEERVRRGEDANMEEPATEPEVEPTPAAAKPKKPEPKGKGRRAAKEAESVDEPYVVKAREIRDQREAAERKAQEEESAAMENTDVKNLRNLPTVDVMEIRPRTNKPVRDGYGEDSSRWDEKWNGRKNFKKFRRNGRGGATRTVRGTVMISLVEHKGSDFGIGDGYWLDDEDQNASKRRVDSRQESPGRDSPYSTARESISRSSRRAATASERQSPAAAPPSQGAKRAAPAEASKPGATKQRKLQLRTESESEDEDSDDGLKFKFRRR